MQIDKFLAKKLLLCSTETVHLYERMNIDLTARAQFDLIAWQAPELLCI